MHSTHDLEREEMIAEIEQETRWLSDQIGKARLAPEVIAALHEVPRHIFVPPGLEDSAYADHPLPIGHGQTISQPFIVALMTDLLAPQPDHRVLEIGTGSGYQGAILARLVEQVYSIEIIPALAHAAAKRFAELGIANVEVRCGDGYQGWAEYAPFDGIVVTAAAPHLPAPLIAQLKPGGRLVIPVGMPFLPQELLVVEKHPDASVSTRHVLGVAFVPLTGWHAVDDRG